MTVDVKALENMFAKTPDELRLLLGEMTAQEMRAAQAVLGWVRATIYALPPAPHGGAEAVPVDYHWRSRIKGGAWDAWERGRAPKHQAPFMDFEERPLYAHPPLSPPQEQEAAPKGEAVAWSCSPDIDALRNGWSVHVVPRKSDAFDVALYTAPPSPKAEPAHPDELAVDRFATALKAKLAQTRQKGRSGWDDPKQCSIEYLSHLLVEHIDKGDPLDVANLAMMIHQRGAVIAGDRARYVAKVNRERAQQVQP